MLRVLAVLLFCLGLFCLGQAPRAQLLMTGIGGAVGSGSGLTGTVTFDNKSLGTLSGGGVTTDTDSLITIGSGTDRALITFLFQVGGATSISAPSITFNGASMTLVQSGTIGTGGAQFIFGLRNPSIGTFSAIANWTTPGQVTMCSASFAGVNPASDAAAFVNPASATGTSTLASVTVTSAVHDYEVAGHSMNANSGLLNGSPTFCSQNGGAVFGFGSNSVAGPTTALTDTLASALWNSIGINLAHD